MTTILQTPSLLTTKAELASAAALVGLAVPKRSAIPGGVRIEIDDTGATLSALNFDGNFATVRLPGVSGGDAGVAVVDHAELEKLLKAITTGITPAKAKAVPVVMTFGEEPTISAAGYTMPITAYPAENYPACPASAPAAVHVDRAEFIETVSRVAMIASTDEAMAVFTAVNLTLKNDHIIAMATDRYRLSQAVIPARSTLTEPVEIAVSAAFLRGMAGHLSGDSIEIGYNADAKTVTFASGDALFGVVGAEPHGFKPEQIAVDNVVATVDIDRVKLLRQTTIARNVVKLKGIDSRASRVAVTVNSTGVKVVPVILGETQVPHIEDALSEGEIEVIFNSEYLIDALKNFTSERIGMHLQPGVRVAIIAETVNTDVSAHTYRHLLMPMRKE